MTSDIMGMVMVTGGTVLRRWTDLLHTGWTLNLISRRESNMDFVIGILIGLFSGVMIGILAVALVSANRDDREDKS